MERKIIDNWSVGTVRGKKYAINGDIRRDELGRWQGQKYTYISPVLLEDHPPLELEEGSVVTCKHLEYELGVPKDMPQAAKKTTEEKSSGKNKSVSRSKRKTNRMAPTTVGEDVGGSNTGGEGE